MKELGKNIKKIVWFAASLFVLFLVIRYWPNLEGIVKLAISAAVPLILGCVMAYVINILMNFYEKWYDRLFKVKVALKIKRIVCIIFAFLSLIGIVLLVVNLVLPELINCIASFIGMIPAAVEWIVEFIGEEEIASYFPDLQDINWSSISTEVEKMIESVLTGVGGAVGSIVSAVSSVFTMIINIVVAIIFSLYVLLDKEKLGTQCRQIIRTYIPKKAEKVFYVVKVMDDSFHSFIVGQVTEAVILGILCIIGMLIFRFPYAVMIGVFIGFTALIPIAGAYIGAAVGAVMMLTTDPLLALEFLVFIVVLQQIEGNLIYPRVVGKSIGLPGIWVLTAITIGGGVLGIGGMLLAVPLCAACYRLLKEDIARRKAVSVAENPVICEAEDAQNKESGAATEKETNIVVEHKEVKKQKKSQKKRKK